MSDNSIVHKLNAILETSKLLNSTRDVNYILESLLQKSLELIEGGDTGVIFLYNRKTGLLEVEAYVGFTDEIEQIRLKPGESMTGAAFINERPMFFQNTEMVNAFMDTMETDNRNLLEISSAKGLHRLQGSIACPLIYQKVCIGTIVIDNFENHAPLVPEDVHILESISVQATIAIINAKSYKRELENNTKLESYNKMLEIERNKYKYSTGLHTKFTDMMLTGCSLVDIITEVSSIIKRDVLLIDLFLNIKDSVFQEPLDQEVLSKIKVQIRIDLQSQNMNQTFIPELLKCLDYFPILVNGETMGWICTLGKSPTFSELDQITVEKASTILALELLKLDELSDMEQSFKGDFLDVLLLNHDSAYLMKCARDFGFNYQNDHVIAIIGSENVPLHLQDDKFRRKQKRYLNHYYQILNTLLLQNFPGSVALIKDQELIFIMELSQHYIRKDIVDFLEKFIVEADQILSKKSKMTPLFIGVSQIIRSIDDFKSGYRNALHTLKTLISLNPHQRFLFFADLEVKQLLINNPPETLNTFLNNTLGPLLAYDKRSKDEFIQTLSIYIRSNGNWTYTKDFLHIHGNTLNYRLTRIMNLLNMDLNDYQQRLKLQIAFEILEINLLHY